VERETDYMILGVSNTESSRGIRSAYRDLAKRLRPDVAREQAMPSFQEVTYAYDVLSDPSRRRGYDEELRRESDGDPISVRHSRAEPFVAESLRVFANRESIQPSFEAMYERLLRNYTGIGVPKAERLEGLNLVVRLSPAAAAHGCTVPVWVPTFSLCPRCHGSGRDWVYPCMFCCEQGTMEHEEVVRVHIPALSPPGLVLEIPLDGLGIHNFYLRLHISVETPPA
jgi:DnaJ-class molecular chaperone